MSEPEGGDAACWAHLVDDFSASHERSLGGVEAVDLIALAAGTVEAVPWSTRSQDLNVNLLHWVAGQGVAAHVNTEVDVLLVGVAGEGEVIVDGESFPLCPGRVVLVPKGRERATLATSEHFSYLTCHQARRGLMPAPRLLREDDYAR